MHAHFNAEVLLSYGNIYSRNVNLLKILSAASKVIFLHAPELFMYLLIVIWHLCTDFECLDCFIHIMLLQSWLDNNKVGQYCYSHTTGRELMEKWLT